MDIWNKKTATHKWTEAAYLLYAKQLSLYKKVRGKWYVFSNVTGWRLSQNDDAWFEEEMVEGFFRQLTKEEKNGLAKGNQQA